MLKRIRQFFWTSVIGGLLFTFSAFSYSPAQVDGKKSSPIEILKEKTTQILKQYNQAIQPLCDQCKLDNLVPKNQELVPIKKYVLISGKYYPYREDHIYNVNGERIYFRDESHWYDEKGEKHEQSAEQAPNTGSLLKSVAGIYSPQNIKNIVDTTNKAKENLEQRNQALQELSNDSQPQAKKQ